MLFFGVNPDMEKGDIKSTVREFMKEYHPDTVNAKAKEQADKLQAEHNMTDGEKDKIFNDIIKQSTNITQSLNEHYNIIKKMF